MHRLRRSRFSNIFLQTKKPSSLDQMLSIWTKGNERFEDDQRIVERIQHWLEINAQSATTLFENIYMESLRDITYTPLLAFFYHWGIGTKVNPDETFHCEILSDILESLLTFDEIISTRDLYSCILVNRQWCKVAMPVLWSNPFYDNCSSVKKQCDLVDTFLNLLSTNQLVQLKAKNYQQNQQQYTTSVIEEVALLTLDLLLPRKKPLFAYAHFVRHLNFRAMIESVNLWCIRNGKRDSFWRVINVLLRLMKNNGARLQSIYGIPETDFSNGIIGFFEKRPELASWISKVKSYRFICGSYDYPRRSITILSSNLNTLELCFGRRRAETERDHCMQFLESMSLVPNLKRFVIKKFREFDMIDTLLFSLTSVAPNLTEIEFIETSFRCGRNFDYTEAIQSLKILSFIKCQ
ncbi:11187_t:CDS:2 [Ambispora gerdemannii]|uniref:11187_t:CDS:1 n=1 Tax=Ambispora gerdemannii TaxID=144530 RepID=A0A9N9GHU7_9GLOM|nr:11187_t:CDS:2 [Ambispora gerdemannii]